MAIRGKGKKKLLVYLRRLVCEMSCKYLPLRLLFDFKLFLGYLKITRISVHVFKTLYIISMTSLFWFYLERLSSCQDKEECPHI